jgi:hypothetical protein
MPQHLANFGQRGTVAQHFGGKRMAKLVRALRGRLDASVCQGIPNERSNRSLTEKAADGRFGS